MLVRAFGGQGGASVRRGGGMRLGVRYGQMTIEDEACLSFDAASVVGVYWYTPHSNAFGCEIGIDYAKPQAEDGSLESNLVSGHADLLFPVGKPGAPARLYLLAGVDALVELVTDATTVYTNYARALNVGGGLGVNGGRFDVRVCYSMPTDSENAQTLATVSVGVGF